MLRSGSGSSTGRGAATSSIENVRYSFSALRSVTISSAARCRASSKSMIGAGCGGAAGCSSALGSTTAGGSATGSVARGGGVTGSGRSRISGSGSSGDGRRCDVRRGRPRNLEHEKLGDRGLLRRRAGPHLPAQRVAREHVHADRDDERRARSGNRTRSPARGERPGSIDGWTTGSSSRIELSRCNADHYDWRGRRMVRRHGLVKRAAARAGANPSPARRRAPARARALRRGAGR